MLRLQGNRDGDRDGGGTGGAHSPFPFRQEEGTAPGRGWLGLGAELRSQVAQGQKQCQELQDKLAASEATVRAQAEQLEKYHVLLRELWGGRDGGLCRAWRASCVHPAWRGGPELTACPAGEPHAQQLSKQVQVDFQDLGYETCGRSETEVDRDETTSPGKESQGLWGPRALPTLHGKVTPCPVPPAECEEPDVFSEPSLGEELGSPCRLGVPRAGKAALKATSPPDVGALCQHIKDLKAQLLNANKVIQSLQRRARSVSITSGYTSGTERPPPGPAALASPSHSLTDEDEGWQSDGRGTLCPPGPWAHHDLEQLVHRVALLEAQLPATKPQGVFPKELQSATWPGYGGGDWGRMGGCRGFRGFSGVVPGGGFLWRALPTTRLSGTSPWYPVHARLT